MDVPGDGRPFPQPDLDVAGPLSAGAVHVWWVDLTRVPVGGLYGLLEDSERARAARLRTAAGHRAFVVTRAVLRRLLAAYLPSREEFRLHYNRYGKPFLASAPRVAFNVSHSGDRAVLAFTAGGPIGVDVEAVDPALSYRRLAQRFFAPAEVAALDSLPPADRLAGFFACWTRKEAFVKAVGDGLSHDLRAFTVSVAPTRPAELLSAPASGWELVDLAPGEGYAAALAVHRAAGSTEVRQWHWPG